MNQQPELSTEAQAQRERFEAFYSTSQSTVMLDIERSVCGCDYGGNSWTTRQDADEIIGLLELDSHSHLLDLGAGSGWPALYMAKISGCTASLVDLPANGLQIAEERAKTDGTGKRITTRVADATDLPFPQNSFDAVSHSDLLCCLENKRQVLANCRRIIRENGHMAFTVISVAPDLTRDQHGRAVSNGPDFIESDVDYTNMLVQTGWKIANRRNVTAGFAASCNRQIEAAQTQEKELAALIGKDVFVERLTRWQTKLAAIRDGLLRRELFLALPR
jgi:cyclopropane fatty-acyl-phospholipid synthase-like methyltransferase